MCCVPNPRTCSTLWRQFSTKKLNMVQSINDAMATALSTEKNSGTVRSPSLVLFGEDVAFGGVFRCSVGLREKFGADRVFNTPLTEQGIVGFAVGMASMGSPVIAEIQFADYIFPAFDQIVNEMAKSRYRSGNQFNCGRIVIRAPYGAVGHGGLYHSQSPEAYFTHTSGLLVVVPRDPIQAKGLLLSSFRSNDPVIFLEPKVLYRSSGIMFSCALVAEVPTEDYQVPIGKADVINSGSDVTLVGWGGQLEVLKKVVDAALSEGIKIELIDLQTLLPWDKSCILSSVEKTGRLVIAHEAPITSGFGAEIAASIQKEAFVSLKAPVERVCGWDTPFPLVFEPFYLPDQHRCLEAVRRTMKFD